MKDKGIFGPSKDSCELLQVLAGAPLGSEVAEEIVISRAETISFLILNCFQYYQRLQECDKEENRYIPSIYGINTNPVSPSGDAVLSQKF
ncbi:hypothetical protein [Leptospira alstonii]|uniref:hypothetical protein n=1 Tax=Leptospira alstonii TaxID=28452 RepID=UPI001F2A2014|nr:hypothetical protein [Leptospira alstonii]